LKATISKPKRTLALIVAIVGLLWLQSSLLAQTPTTLVQAKGVGTIYQGDKALARDQAINDGLRKAVEAALGTWIKSETVVENFMIVEDNILNWSNGYVKHYDILSEMATAEDMYEVTLNAEVEMANLTQDQDMVQSLLDKMGNPRTMVMFDEKNIGESYNRYHFFSVDMTQAENTMIEVFQDKGFPMVDPATVRANIKREQALAALEGDTRAAAAIGLSFEAEVVITGKAIAKVASSRIKALGDMKSCQANVNAKVIKTDDGTIIATGSEHAAAVHIDEITGGTQAIEKATQKLSKELIKKILKKWRDEFYTQTTVKLRINGLESQAQLSEFIGILKYYMRGVKQANQRNYAAGTAEVDVKITGNANQLARELERKNLDKFEAKINRTTANTINLTLSVSDVDTYEDVPADTTGMY